MDIESGTTPGGISIRWRLNEILYAIRDSTGCTFQTTVFYEDFARWIFNATVYYADFCYILFLQLYCSNGISRMGNFGQPSPGEASCDGVMLPNLRCIAEELWHGHGIFNVPTDVNACGCTQGCTNTVKELTVGEKFLAAPGNRTCVGGVPVRCSTNWATSPPLFHWCRLKGTVSRDITFTITYYIYYILQGPQRDADFKRHYILRAFPLDACILKKGHHTTRIFIGIDWRNFTMQGFPLVLDWKRHFTTRNLIDSVEDWSRRAARTVLQGFL